VSPHRRITKAASAAFLFAGVTAQAALGGPGSGCGMMNE